MNERDALLIRLLAQRDAVFVPQRRFAPDCRANANVYLLRSKYAQNGMPWSSGVSGVADRKRFTRMIEELAEEGIVEPMRLGIKLSGVKLTDAGETEARSAAGLATFYCAWPRAIFQAILRRDGFAVMEDHLIPAWRRVTGADNGECGCYLPQVPATWTREEALAHIAIGLTPYTVRGWLTSAATRGGVAFYAPGPDAPKPPDPAQVEEARGRLNELLSKAQSLPDPSTFAGEGFSYRINESNTSTFSAQAAFGFLGAAAIPRARRDCDPELRKLYLQEFREAYELLAVERPSDAQEIGPIPLAESAVTEQQLEEWKRSKELADRGE